MQFSNLKKVHKKCLMIEHKVVLNVVTFSYNIIQSRITNTVPRLWKSFQKIF